MMTSPAHEVLEACRQFLVAVPENLNYISAGQVKEILDANPASIFILDNRTADAYNAGHIPGSVNIWMKELLNPENLAKLPGDRLIVVCCWVGHSASQVVTVLQLIGYRAVGLKYGMGVPRNPHEPRSGWLDLGFPTIGSVSGD
jgi:rhodanese-related sulfurtransferase